MVTCIRSISFLCQWFLQKSVWKLHSPYHVYGELFMNEVAFRATPAAVTSLQKIRLENCIVKTLIPERKTHALEGAWADMPSEGPDELELQRGCDCSDDCGTILLEGTSTGNFKGEMGDGGEGLQWDLPGRCDAGASSGVGKFGKSLTGLHEFKTAWDGILTGGSEKDDKRYDNKYIKWNECTKWKNDLALLRLLDEIIS